MDLLDEFSKLNTRQKTVLFVWLLILMIMIGDLAPLIPLLIISYGVYRFITWKDENKK